MLSPLFIHISFGYFFCSVNTLISLFYNLPSLCYGITAILIPKYFFYKKNIFSLVFTDNYQDFFLKKNEQKDKSNTCFVQKRLQFYRDRGLPIDLTTDKHQCKKSVGTVYPGTVCVKKVTDTYCFLSRMSEQWKNSSGTGTVN
jgi:hypothetical protein